MIPVTWIFHTEALMETGSSALEELASGWRSLKGLRPRPLELERISLVRACRTAELSDPSFLEDLIARLGLNDEGIDEFPAWLHASCGAGLRIWQYPAQFAPYLASLAGLGVRSYLEIGVRHGGSFVATVEVLERFAPLDFAVGVDVIPCPSLGDYSRMNPRSRFACVNTMAPAFEALLRDLAPIDLVFVDSHHEAAQCRREIACLEPHANMIAFHDIANRGCPGIGAVWSELRASGAWHCSEFVAQYPGLGPYMGIGLAVKPARLREAR
jgi:hypothetical protein